MRNQIFLVPAVLLLIASCAAPIRPVQPQQGRLAEPAHPSSRIVVPVRLDLDSLARDLDRGFDRWALVKESRKDGWFQWSLGIIRTGAVRLRADETRLQVQLPLRLEAAVSGGGALGALKPPPVGVDLPLSFSLPLDPGPSGDWSLAPPEIRMPQLPSVFKDSKLVGNLVRSGEGSVQAILERYVTGPLRARIRKAWEDAQQPIALAGQGWLQIRPDTLLVQGWRSLDSSHVEMKLGMVAEVRYSLSRPEDPVRPLVHVRKVHDLQAGLAIGIPVQASFAELQKRVSEQVVGKRFHSGNRWLEVSAVRLSGTGGQAVDGSMVNGILADVDFDAETGSWFFGHKSGTLHLLAVPSLDTSGQRLSLAGFQATTETRSVLVDKGLQWMLDLGYEKVLGLAQLNLKATAEKPLKALETTLQKGIPVGPVMLHGHVESVRFSGFYLDENGFDPWVRIAGDLAVSN